MIDKCWETESESFTGGQVATQPRSSIPTKSVPKPTQSSAEKMKKSLPNAFRAIAPAWPLKDMVAVNPFTELADRNLFELHSELRTVRDTQLLMPLSYYQAQFDHGVLTKANISQALTECSKQFPNRFDGISWEALELTLAGQPKDEEGDRQFLTIAEVADKAAEAPHWVALIIDDVSKYCAAYFDAGQAIWNAARPSTEATNNLYSSWKQLAEIDRRLEVYGLPGFRKFVSDLPDTPEEAIEVLTKACGVPEVATEKFWQAELFSVGGWASYAKYVDRINKIENVENGELASLLAIRLAYDYALVHLGAIESTAIAWSAKPSPDSADHSETKICYVLQTALEIAYRSKMLDGVLAARPSFPTGTEQAPAEFNLVFCIDVRSEIIRRHLESQSSGLNTFGFAGFFGIAAQHQSPASAATNQCPVLLDPAVVISESGASADELGRQRSRGKFLLEGIKRLQGAAVSGFAFVESWGLSYLPSMISSAFRPSLRKAGLAGKTPTSQTTSTGCDVHLQDLENNNLSVEAQADVAASILKHLGLTKNFGKLSVFCGHGSATVNNPLRAGLDCGACGGHSGESNAKMAATLLNSPEVRKILATKGYSIPDETHFMAAVHNTTTDELRFLDTEKVPAALASDLAALQAHCDAASALARAERAKRFVDCSDGEQLPLRSTDWSEVRPEWGLAGNAAFVVAPRWRTKQLKLGGRSFLHSYEYEQDEGFATLELILTAPMVVTNWINMQYYASVVDNKNYGCGNKAIHNVVGKIGVQEGNGGDLRNGLALQSIHDGEGLQHEPLRLQVFVEAPRDAIADILGRHAHVEDLAAKGWLHLHAIESGDSETCYRYLGSGHWDEIRSLEQTASAN